MKTHYHVIGGFHGCMSEMNLVYASKIEARSALKEEIAQLRETGNTFHGSLKAGYFEASKKTDILGDYLEITECDQAKCMEAEN